MKHRNFGMKSRHRPQGYRFKVIARLGMAQEMSLAYLWICIAYVLGFCDQDSEQEA